MSFITSNLKSHNFNIIPVTKDSTHFEERERRKIVPYHMSIDAAERSGVRMRPRGTWPVGQGGEHCVANDLAIFTVLIGVTRDTKGPSASQRLLFLPQLCQTLRTQTVGNLTGRKLSAEKL